MECEIPITAMLLTGVAETRRTDLAEVRRGRRGMMRNKVEVFW